MGNIITVANWDKIHAIIKEKTDVITERQEEIIKQQKLLEEKIKELNEKQLTTLKVNAATYIKCLHMGSISRYLNRDACDKAIDELINLTFDAVDDYNINQEHKQLNKKIAEAISED